MTPPPFAFTVTFVIPVVAVLVAEKVRVELPLPGAAIEAGLKLAVTPEGSPDADKDTVELNPPLTVLETVVLPELPWVTDTLAGEALIAKSGVAAGLTVRATIAV
jgi:hypothetical protein